MSAPVYSFDMGKNFACVGPEGVMPFRSLRETIESLSDCTLVGEKSFASFRTHERDELILLCAERGINFQVCSPRLTKTHDKNWNTKASKEAKYHDKESDKIDAFHIRHLYTKGLLLTHAPKLQADIVVPDRTFLEEVVKGIRGETNLDSFLSLLPPPAEVPEGFKELLLSGKKYNPAYARYFALAATQAKTRREFERLVGCYGEGYPNVLRSRFFYYAVDALVGGQEAATHAKNGHLLKRPRLYKPPKRTVKEAMKLARRTVRWVYHQVCEGHGQLSSRNGQALSSALTLPPGVTGKFAPATGNFNPQPPADL